MNEYAERLRQQDNTFDSAPIAGQKNAVPEAEYQAVVNRFDYIDTSKGLKLKTEMSVAVGPQTGSELECWHDLEDPEKHKYLKAHLMALGVPLPASLADLDASLRGALDCPVHVRVVERNGYKNVYVQQRLGTPLGADTVTPVTPAAPAPAAAATANDDIPF